MQKLGINSRIMEIVLRCVRTVTYSVRINGIPRGRSIPTRGLR